MYMLLKCICSTFETVQTGTCTRMSFTLSTIASSAVTPMRVSALRSGSLASTRRLALSYHIEVYVSCFAASLRPLVAHPVMNPATTAIPNPTINLFILFVLMCPILFHAPRGRRAGGSSMPRAAVSIEQERRTPEILSFRGTAKSSCRNMNRKVRRMDNRMDNNPRARTVVVRFCIRKLAVF